MHHIPTEHDLSSSGDTPELNTWLLLASTAGRFRPSATLDGWLDVGELVGHVVRSGHESPVRSTRAGMLMGLLADEGELVRDAQPLAWLELAS